MIQGPAFRVSRLRLAVPLAALFLTACPPPPPPPPLKVEPPPPQPTEAPPPPLAPSRWVESKGSTLIGPTIEGGTLVLLGGRRVLVAKDGTAKAETAHAPEGLVGLTEVVTAGGARKLVGYSEHAVYLLADVLGEPKTLARTEGEIWKVSAGPGVVAVWDFESDVPRYIDVETGQLKTLSNMPSVPANSLAFRNAKEGAAIFEAVGLAITTDGGATWKPAGETNKGDATRASDLKLRGDSVYASVGYGRSDVPIDFAGGKLGASGEPQAPSGDAPLLKWVRRAERDPLSEAAQSGVLLPSGDALVVAAGLLARVDMKTGLVTEVVEVSGEDARSCGIVRAGDTAWLGCSLPESEASEEYYEPFGVYKISLTSGKLALERPAVKRSADAEIRTSPSGGVMIVGGCGAEGSNEELCVRQPDGKWATIRPSLDPYERGAGPLADGRVAYLRGLFEGEDPPEDVAPAAPSGEGAEGSESPPEGRKAWIVAVDSSGKEHTIVTISLPRASSELSVRGYLQEGEDKRLHGAVMSEEGPHMLIAPPSKTPVELQAIQGASSVKLAGSFGVAFGEKLLGTTDGGATWAEISAPRRVAEMLGLSADPEARGYGYEDLVALSDAGLRIEQFARVGWGAPEALPDEREPTGGIALQRPPLAPVPGAERAPVCTTDGAGQGATILNGSYQAQEFFIKGQPAKGTKRRSSGSPSGRFGMLDPIGAMMIEGPDKAGGAPAKWSLFWIDPAEPSAKTRTVTAPAPKDSLWDVSVRSVAAAGSRAIFAVRSGSKYILIRTKGAGIETAEVTIDLLPSYDVVFGTDKGEPIVWSSTNAIVVWQTGEEPRVIANITGRASRALGQPTKDGVPVLLTSTSWGLAKVLSIPAIDKKDKNAKPAPHPQGVWLEGWTPIANYKREMGKYPACGKNPKGFRVLASRYAGTANVDGVEESTQMGAYDMRVNGNEVCVASIIEFLSPIARQTPKDTKPKAGGAVPGPVSFLRYDLLANRAEGGDRGLPKEPAKGAPKPPPPVRKLTCKYEEKK